MEQTEKSSLVSGKIANGATTHAPVRFLNGLTRSGAFTGHLCQHFGNGTVVFSMIRRGATGRQTVGRLNMVEPGMPVEEVFDITFAATLPIMVDGDLVLRLADRVSADHVRGFSPYYSFLMVNGDSGAVMGFINLRIGHTHNDRYFRGNIGFGVDEAFRGRRYAARGCRLLVPLVHHHGLCPVWLTCNVDNQASMRTMAIIGAHHVETITMRDDYAYAEYYPPSGRVKCRYRWEP